MVANDARQVTVDGLLQWQWPDGTRLPVIRGGDGPAAGTGGGEGDGGEGGNGGGEGGDPPPASGSGDESGDDGGLSQDEVNKIAAREKQQGRRAAESEIAEKLGVTVDEAAEIIKAAKDREKEQMTEAERARAEAEEERAKAKAESEQARADRQAAAVERQLLRAGLNVPADDDDKAAERLARAVRLVDIDAEADDINTAARDAVATLKDDMPELFTGTAPTNGGGRSGDPQGGKPPPQKTKSGMSKGAERAQRELERRRGVTAGAKEE